MNLIPTSLVPNFTILFAILLQKKAEDNNLGALPLKAFRRIKLNDWVTAAKE